MDKEAITYETNALHLSAHMFFERQEVKQKLMVVLQEFVYKSGANKKCLKLCTTHNKKVNEDTKLSDSSFDMGFVDKCVEIIRLRNKLNKISAEM